MCLQMQTPQKLLANTPTRETRRHVAQGVKAYISFVRHELSAALSRRGGALAASARRIFDDNADMPLSSDSSDGEGAAPRPPQQLTSPEKPIMPAAYTSAASLVQPVKDNEWSVRMGEDVPKFLYANGPGRVVRYNLNVEREHIASQYVIRNRSGKTPDYADIVALTPAGQNAVGTIIGWMVWLACTGESLYGKAAPNCLRLCCSNFGGCDDDCDGGERHDSCGFRVVIKATLDDIRAGQVVISVHGDHVPPGVQAKPPPLNGLKPMFPRCCVISASSASRGSFRRRPSTTQSQGWARQPSAAHAWHLRLASLLRRASIPSARLAAAAWTTLLASTCSCAAISTFN
jgi:hypothetical protein